MTEMCRYISEAVHPSAGPRPRRVNAESTRRQPAGTASESNGVKPGVSVGRIPLESADGVYTIGREAFPSFGLFARLGVHVQSNRVRPAHPDPA